ncbi:hypothetical protein QBC39DRAFT_161063 [Podospora conica]|nr:hypothetical protein QBC39DRAFT_161063 [Schizothecium conicum]
MSREPTMPEKLDVLLHFAIIAVCECVNGNQIEPRGVEITRRVCSLAATGHQVGVRPGLSGSVIRGCTRCIARGLHPRRGTTPWFFLSGHHGNTMFQKRKEGSHPTLNAARWSDPRRGNASITPGPPTTSGGGLTPTARRRSQARHCSWWCVPACRVRPEHESGCEDEDPENQDGPFSGPCTLFAATPISMMVTSESKFRGTSRTHVVLSNSPQDEQQLFVAEGGGGRDSRQPQQPPR